ncbi:MAG: T9SS type A sorting domain-containing protein, partial [Bacteroidales bacterium]|nr:T9SS type A sorting domain-containing protein [Bacteroidales bacterium]
MVSSCLPPSSLTADPVDTFSATIHFADPQHEDWDVAIAAGGGIPDESALLTLHGTPWYTFTDLDSGTVYTVFVRAHCDGEELSEWAMTTFTTLSAADTTQHGGGDDTTGVAHYADLPSVKLYPNPANEHLNVLVSGTSPVTSIELFDVFGKIVRTIDACHSTNSHTIRINTDDLAPGVYFVRVVTDAGKTTKRFVKQ